MSPGQFTNYDDSGAQNIPGWTTPGSWDGVQNAVGAYSAAPDGANFAYDDGGTISQVLTSDLNEGIYTLTVAVGHRASRETIPGGELVLLAGGNVLESINVADPGQGNFTDESLIYTAPAGNPYLGQTLQIELISNGGGYNAGQTIDFDNVRLDFAAAVPEPSAWALMLGGAVLLLGSRRLSRKSS